MVCGLVWVDGWIASDMYLEEIGLHAQSMIIRSRLNRQHSCEDLYDRLISMSIFTSKNVFIRAPKITRKVAMASIWVCKPSCINRIIHIQMEKVG